jgi:hypothetical protein
VARELELLQLDAIEHAKSQSSMLHAALLYGKLQSSMHQLSYYRSPLKASMSLSLIICLHMSAYRLFIAPSRLPCDLVVFSQHLRGLRDSFSYYLEQVQGFHVSLLYYSQHVRGLHVTLSYYSQHSRFLHVSFCHYLQYFRGFHFTLCDCLEPFS